MTQGIYQVHVLRGGAWTLSPEVGYIRAMLLFGAAVENQPEAVRLIILEEGDDGRSSRVLRRWLREGGKVENF